ARNPPASAEVDTKWCVRSSCACIQCPVRELTPSLQRNRNSRARTPLENAGFIGKGRTPCVKVNAVVTTLKDHMNQKHVPSQSMRTIVTALSAATLSMSSLALTGCAGATPETAPASSSADATQTAFEVPVRVPVSARTRVLVASKLDNPRGMYVFAD